MLHNNYNGNHTNGDGEEAEHAQGPGAVLSPSRILAHVMWAQQQNLPSSLQTDGPTLPV